MSIHMIKENKKKVSESSIEESIDETSDKLEINFVKKLPLNYSSDTLKEIKIHTTPSLNAYCELENDGLNEEDPGIYVRKYLYALIEDPKISKEDFLNINDSEISNIIELILDNEPELNSDMKDKSDNLIPKFKEIVNNRYQKILTELREAIGISTPFILKQDFFKDDLIFFPQLSEALRL